MLSHLVQLPGPCSQYIIWVQIAVRLDHQSSSCLFLLLGHDDTGNGSKMHSVAHLSFGFASKASAHNSTCVYLPQMYTANVLKNMGVNFCLRWTEMRFTFTLLAVRQSRLSEKWVRIHRFIKSYVIKSSLVLQFGTIAFSESYQSSLERTHHF